ncbi:MAG: hypothetical protein BMS9Abin05_2170 [Rhodothermia bacterium]|nr:MAG: hypothetical protein BMS9Abin05_2170 [Rhodothermia bacterium]
MVHSLPSLVQGNGFARLTAGGLSLAATNVNPEISELFNVDVEEMYASGTEFEYLVRRAIRANVRASVRGLRNS